MGYALITKPLHLFLVQVIFGVAGAIGAPAYNGLFSKNLDRGKYITEWGIYDASYYCLTGIAAILGGFLAKYYGFPLVFAIMETISFAGFIVSFLFLRIDKKRKKK